MVRSLKGIPRRAASSAAGGKSAAHQPVCDFLLPNGVIARYSWPVHTVVKSDVRDYRVEIPA